MVRNTIVWGGNGCNRGTGLIVRPVQDLRLTPAPGGAGIGKRSKIRNFYVKETYQQGSERQR